MIVDVKGAEEVLRVLNEVERGILTQKIVDQAAILVQARIIADTLQGKDSEGKSFRPYSPGYAKIRQEKGLPTGKVDLFFSGKMQSGLMHKSSNQEAQLFFAPSEAEKAYRHDEGIGVPKRPFFRPTEKDSNAIMALVKQRVDEVLRG